MFISVQIEKQKKNHLSSNQAIGMMVAFNGYQFVSPPWANKFMTFDKFDCVEKNHDFPSTKGDQFVICTFPAEREKLVFFWKELNFVQPAMVPGGRDFILSRSQVLAQVLRPNHHSVLFALISLEFLLEIASSSPSFCQKTRRTNFRFGEPRIR